ncbi:hypothetical protein GWI33_021346 [Rhynchophorus ferrugineus]|uniref:Thioredoxin domain-containing protein n=1 Tax=Rhynchophorus ferrugineus TaxID=354439 RepID=A0A834HP98_RHYFE|nr:hypothetical protein GWI33_021346 [Rhynchophorus ferrugineus]
MYFSGKYREKAELLPSKVKENRDKNELGENSAQNNSDSEDEIEQNCEVKDPVNEIMKKMVNLLREIAICCLIFVAYAAITKDPPKISKAPTAYPFFPKNSVVKDFYKGQINEAIEEARSSDFSFLMFYAPWDAESQSARKEILATANYLKNNIVFAAVNCWQPGSECHNQYSKVYRWPILIVYPAFGTGLQYNGPIDQFYMISFLQKLMQPIKKVSNNMLDLKQNYVVAEINASPGEIGFYIKPVKETKNKITLSLWNEIYLYYIDDGQWNADKLLQWIIKETVSSNYWILPSGSKSLLLSNYLQPGPSLILFTPMNPVFGHSDYYMMLQEIIHDYKNCDNGRVFDMEERRKINKFNYKQHKKLCKNKTILHKSEEILVTTNVIFFNGTRNMENNIHLTSLCQNMDNYAKQCYSINHLKPPKILDETIKYKQLNNFYRTSMLDNDLDPRSMNNLKKYYDELKCKNYFASEALHPFIFEVEESKTDKESLAGLGCMNKTLNFVVLNSLLYYHFAEKLGIDLSRNHYKSAVVIVNDKAESHYIMKGSITSSNIRKFIRDFTDNALVRSTSSILDIPISTSLTYQSHSKNGHIKMFYIEELNSKQFLNVVLDKKKCIVVMYYSKQCSFCNGVAYTFLTLARKLSFVPNIQFARIDGDLNILPWEYTMEKYPTILFFPMFKKEETRVFPADLQLNLSNLLNFILSNVDSGTRLNVMYSLCLHYQIEKDRISCFSSVRNNTIILISKTLEDWRKSNNRQRQILLHNLKQLKQLHFLFSHNPEKVDLIKSYFNKFNKEPTRDYNVASIRSVKGNL